MGLFDFFKRQSPRVATAATTDRENERWLNERGGQVVEKKAANGETNLTDWEKLLHRIWLADYMMRNAGDFANAVDLCPTFQTDAADLAKLLGLPATHEAFSLSQRKLQKEYFARFDAICLELKALDPEKSRPSSPSSP